MENGDETAEHLEMAAVKEGNHTHAAIDIDWRASQIDCLCPWQVMYHYPVILNCVTALLRAKLATTWSNIRCL
jgi:hypothetical protein